MQVEEKARVGGALSEQANRSARQVDVFASEADDLVHTDSDDDHQGDRKKG